MPSFVLLLLLLLPMHASATVGGYYDYNGFRYQLANAAVDVDAVSVTGDDCAATPCPSFAIPASCSASFPTTDLSTVALAKGWGTSFLAGPDGLYTVSAWLSNSNTLLVDTTSVAGSAALTDAGWDARIVLQCKIPCPAGTILIGSVCSACGVGKWSAAGDTVCQNCTNAPAQSVYTSTGAGSSNCSFACGANTYIQPFPRPFLVVGDLNALRLVNSATGVVSTLYRPRSTDATYAATFLAPSSLNSLWVYYGTYSINRVDLSASTFTTIAGGNARGSADGVGTAAGFNNLVAVVPWQSEAYLLALDSMNCNLRQINLATKAVTTVLGNLACGFQDGTGLGAYLQSPTDLVINAAQTTAYIADAGNYRIRAVVLSTMAATTLVGSGAAGNVDGLGASAAVDPRYLALGPDPSVLYVKTISTVRQITIATGQITTLPPVSLGLSAFQMVVSGLNPNIAYYAGAYTVNTLILSSGQSTLIAGNGVASLIDGKGSAAGFANPFRMFILNETLSGSTCAACTVCPVGQYGICNATTSACFVCLAGKYTSAPGATACSPCPVGTYGTANGVCAACPAGAYSLSAGATACANCSAGTYLFASGCVNCSGGTYSVGGTTFCAQCANLVGNATYGSLPGTNSSNCPFACNAGFNYVQGSNTCSQCSVGQWSAAGYTTCSACSAQPVNGTFAGVGTNATNCPFNCNAGYYAANTACMPCAAGTRMLNGACTACVASSYSNAAAVACTTCGSGTYSAAGASACSLCANQGPYTLFIGRSTTVSCPFYCTAGAYVANRTVCAPCVNGTFAATTGVTTCSNCALGTWSGLASTACTACSALQITAANGTGMQDYPYLSKAGWGVTAVVCVP